MTRRATAVAAVVLAVAASAGISLWNGFVYDDIAAVAANPIVTSARWHDVIWHTYWLGTLWRPWTTAAFALQWMAGGGRSWLFHLASLTAYAALGGLLLALLRRAAGAAGGAAAPVALAVTMLFLVHPVHTEAVASVVGQAELWTGLALVGAMLIYRRARERGPLPGDLAALLAIVFIGIASKEQGFMIPVVLAGMELLLFAGRGEPVGERLRLLVPAALLAALLFVVRSSVVGGALGETPALAWRGVGLAGRALTVLAVAPLDARLLVWPWHLAAEYGPPAIPIGGPVTLRHIVGLAIVLACVAAFVVARRRAPWCAVGLWCMAAMLLPVSNLLAPTGLVAAERVLFLPSIGLAIAVAGAVAPLIARMAVTAPVRVAAIVAVGSACIAMAARSAARATVWRDQAGFYAHLVTDSPDSYLAWKVAAAYRETTGDTARAITSLRRAWQLWPHDAQVPEQLGQIYRRAGRCDVAVPVFGDGLVVDPRAESLRAKLVECLIAERRWQDARVAAEAGIALGEPEFASVVDRVDRMKGNDTLPRVR